MNKYMILLKTRPLRLEIQDKFGNDNLKRVLFAGIDDIPAEVLEQKDSFTNPERKFIKHYLAIHTQAKGLKSSLQEPGKLIYNPEKLILIKTIGKTPSGFKPVILVDK